MLCNHDSKYEYGNGGCSICRDNRDARDAERQKMRNYYDEEERRQKFQKERDREERLAGTKKCNCDACIFGYTRLVKSTVSDPKKMKTDAQPRRSDQVAALPIIGTGRRERPRWPRR